ncbi:putative reverse transcriptase domain-containing protein, partial [Tanacetum coccineum]
DMFAGHPWIRNTANELKVPLDISILKLMKAYMRSSALRKAALRALSKTLTVDELFYLKEQFSLLEPSKNGSINMENIKAALMKHATDAMKESRVHDFLASLNALQYRRMDFEEFCAAAINIYQLEALDRWEQHARMGSLSKVIENQVMAISIISVSSDSSEDNVGTPTDTIVIPTEIPIITPTIPPSLDYTPASPDYSSASETKSDLSEDPSSDHIPSLPATSLFLSLTNDITNSDTPDTPPLPTHGTPFTEITSSTQRSPVIPRRRVMILAPGQPIPHGRPYCSHPNGPVHMMTVRKRVGPLPIQQLAASSDLHSYTSSDSSSRHSFSDHSSPDLLSTSAGPSRKRRRSPMTSVPASPPVSRALSPVRADLIPSPKRIRSPKSATNLEGCSEDSFEPYVPREVRLGVDVEDESYEQSRSKGTDIEVDDDVERSDEIDIDPVEAVIEAYFDFADTIIASGVDVRV